MYIFCSIKLSTFWQTFALIRARLELLIHGRHLPIPSIKEGGGPSSARQFVGDLHKIPLEAVASLGQLRVVISLFLTSATFVALPSGPALLWPWLHPVSPTVSQSFWPFWQLLMWIISFAAVFACWFAKRFNEARSHFGTGRGVH